MVEQEKRKRDAFKKILKATFHLFSMESSMFDLIHEMDCGYTVEVQHEMVKVCVVLLRKDFWGFSSDDTSLSLWHSRGLACVTQSNCRRLDKTLSGTLTNPKANCRSDKDRLSFSILSGSSCRARSTASSLILGQCHCMWAEVWCGVSVSCVLTWGHKCNFHLEAPQCFFFIDV